MKITHNKVGQNLNIADGSKSEKAGKSEKASVGKVSDGPSLLEAKSTENTAGKSTKVDVSERAQDLKKIKELANSAPDIDEAKVAKFQKMIDEGNYKMDAEAIADKMVDDHLAFS